MALAPERCSSLSGPRHRRVSWAGWPLWPVCGSWASPLFSAM